MRTNYTSLTTGQRPDSNRGLPYEYLIAILKTTRSSNVRAPRKKKVNQCDRTKMIRGTTSEGIQTKIVNFSKLTEINMMAQHILTINFSFV